MDKKIKIQPLKGFRDFLPEEAIKRQYVIDKIRTVFESYGYDPIETPALEYQSLLLGKYGEEADKLVYKFEDEGKRKIALRYDQTVPTARIISQYQFILPLPFKRYQIQPVWRAEKPQKGRFREFLQCDPDVYGTLSPLADAEIIAITAKSLESLGLTNYKILINDREILFQIIDQVGITKKDALSVIRIIDKLDKKPKNEVTKELKEKGLSQKTVSLLFDTIKKSQPTENLRRVIAKAISFGVPRKQLIFRPFLARGLDYYTSTIFEAVIKDYKEGAVAGGGRYDNLIGNISGAKMPAVGISFGFDRIVEAMEQFGLLPKKKTVAQVLVTIFSPNLLGKSIEVVNGLRMSGIPTELYLDPNVKLDKQLKYADKKGILYVIIIGPEEAAKGKITIKKMATKEQRTVPLKDISPEKVLF